MQVHDRLWSDFSFVASSGHREKVMAGRAATPKLPGQRGRETKLRLTHVSRALRELAGRGLGESLTPSAKGPGRLYALTKSGASLAAYRRNASHRVAPTSTHPRA